MDASVCGLVPVVDVDGGKLTQTTSLRAEIGEGREVHLDVAAQCEVAAGLTAVGNEVVVSLDVPRLGQQTNGFHVGQHAVGEPQGVVCAGPHTVHPNPHRGLPEVDVVEHAVHRPVQPNSPAKCREIDQTSGQRVGDLKRQAPLPWRGGVVVFQAIASEQDGRPQGAICHEGSSPDPDARTVVGIDLRTWQNGQGAPRVHKNPSVDDMWQLCRPHFITRQGGVLVGATVKHGVLATCEQLHLLDVAVGHEGQLVPNPKRRGPCP